MKIFSKWNFIENLFTKFIHGREVHESNADRDLKKLTSDPKNVEIKQHQNVA